MRGQLTLESWIAGVGSKKNVRAQNAGVCSDHEHLRERGPETESVSDHQSTQASEIAFFEGSDLESSKEKKSELSGPTQRNENKQAGIYPCEKDSGAGQNTSDTGLSRTVLSTKSAQNVAVAELKQKEDHKSEESDNSLIDRDSEVPDGAEYERERQERIRQNQMILKNLGIKSLKMEPKKDMKRQRPSQPHRENLRKSTRVYNQTGEPIRRSSRLAGQNLEAGSSAVDIEVSENQESVYERSGCSYSRPAAWLTSFGVEPTRENGSLGTATAITQMPNPGLLRTYSMSMEQNLLAAGGKSGMASVFTVPEEETAEITPKINAKLHTSWISDLQLLPASSGSAPALFTASNDGAIKMWDVSTLDVNTGLPLCTLSCNSMHNRGVFSAHVNGDKLITGSKDSTVGLGTLIQSEVAGISYLGDHHHGVVKAVRWRNETEFASGGNDSKMVLYDRRKAGYVTQVCEGAHKGAVNALEWHPNDGNIVATAGFDPFLHLWDVRQFTSPLHSFSGHNLKERSSTIYRPTFLRGGELVACSGEGTSSISIYDTATGACEGRIDVGFTPSCLLCPSRDKLLLAAATTNLLLMLSFDSSPGKETEERVGEISCHC